MKILFIGTSEFAVQPLSILLKNSFHGPILIEVLGSKIALGRGMAHKIKVS